MTRRLASVMCLLAMNALYGCDAPDRPILLRADAANARGSRDTLVVEGLLSSIHVNSQGLGGEPGLHTVARLQVVRVLEGTAPGSELAVQVPGGVSGRRMRVVTHQPRLIAGRHRVTVRRISAAWRVVALTDLNRPAPVVSGREPLWQVDAGAQASIESAR